MNRRRYEDMARLQADLERERTLRSMHRQAASDPLQGLHRVVPPAPPRATLGDMLRAWLQAVIASLIDIVMVLAIIGIAIGVWPALWALIKGVMS